MIDVFNLLSIEFSSHLNFSTNSRCVKISHILLFLFIYSNILIHWISTQLVTQSLIFFVLRYKVNEFIPKNVWPFSHSQITCIASIYNLYKERVDKYIDSLDQPTVFSASVIDPASHYSSYHDPYDAASNNDAQIQGKLYYKGEERRVPRG